MPTDVLQIKLETTGDGKVKASLAGVSKELEGVGGGASKASIGIGDMLPQVTALGVALGAWNLASIADHFHSLQDRIKTATKETGDYVEVSAALYDISQANGAALETTVGLFQSLARTAPELKVTNKEILTLTDLVQQLGVIGGSSAQQMQDGLLQFSQGMAGGILRAEEFNSIIENLPELGNRIAKGMGKTVGELREAVLAGEVLSKDVFDSLLKQAPEIAAEFADIPVRMDKATTMLGNSLTNLVAKLDESVGLSKNIAASMAIVSGWLDDATSETPEADRYAALTVAIRDARMEVEKFTQLRDDATFGFTADGYQQRIDEAKDAIAAAEREQAAITRRMEAREAENTAREEANRLAQDEKDRAKYIEDQAAALDKLANSLLKEEVAAARAKEQEKLLLEGITLFPEQADRYRRALAELHKEHKTGASDTARFAADLQRTLDSLFPEAREAREYFDTIEQLDEALARGNLTAREHADALAALHTQYADLGEKATEATGKIAKSASKVADKQKQAFDGMAESMNSFGDQFINSAADWAMGAEGSFDDLDEAFGKMLLSMAMKAALSPVFDAIGTGMESFFNGMYGGGGTTAAGTRATGGPVSAGMTYLVGERGPELLTMGANGHVTPNHQLGGSTQSMPVTINVTNEGGQPKQAQASADFDGEGLIVQVFLRDVDRDGPMSGAMASKFNLQRRVG